MLISIHGSDLRKVAWIDNDKPHTLNYFDDVWTRYLETGSSIFEFTVYKKAVKSDLGDNRAYNLLNDKAFVSFKYKGRSYVFSVMQIDEDETTMHCVCENLNLELINEYSNPYKASKAMTFSEYCKAMELLNFSLLQIGRNEVEEKKLTLEWEGTETKLARLLSLAVRFDAELEFETRLRYDSTIKSFLVHVYKSYDGVTNNGVGQIRSDISLVYGKNLRKMTRKIDKTGIFNAVRATGKRENGEIVTIAGASEIEVKNSKGQVEFYQKGEMLYAPLSMQRYPAAFTSETTSDQWIRKDMTVESDNPTVIRSAALASLRKNAYPAITYELDGWVDADIGDTVKITDNGFTPTLIVQARVFEQSISFTKPSRNKTVFANAKALENQLSDDAQGAIKRMIEELQPYSIRLATTNGVMFKNGQGTSTVIPSLYRGIKQITGATWRYLVNGEETQTGAEYVVNASSIVSRMVLTVCAYIGNAEVFRDNLTFTNVSDGERGKDGAQGPKGEKGDRGIDGIAGKDGVGIKSTVITYGLSTSDTTQPSTWATTVPNLVKGQYLWTKTVWTYTDNTSETGYTKTYVAKDGNNGSNGIAGKDGVGIKTTSITYASSSSGTTAPTSGWTSAVPSVTPGQYLWTKTVWTYTDNTSETGYSVAKMGDTGAKGAKGDPGQDGLPGAPGVGIKSTVSTYGLSANETTQPTSWSASVPTLVKGQYLWAKTVWTYTDNKNETGYTKTYIARDGNDGTNGIAGKDGVGIRSTTITYGQSASGTVQPTAWTSTVPSVPAGQFLWTKTVWTYTDNTSETGYSVAKMGETGPKGDQGPQGLNGLQGPKGDQGLPGAKGADGKTSYTHIAYANSANGQSAFSMSDSNRTYIGVYVDQVATDSTDPTRYKWTLIKGAYGAQGVPGAKGADGRTPYLHIAYANNSAGTAGFSTTDSAGRTYIGQYTDYTAADSSNPASYKWTLIKGADGASAYFYVAYADSPDGSTGFNLTDASKRYMGHYSSSNPTQSTSAASYKWIDRANVTATFVQSTAPANPPTGARWKYTGSTVITANSSTIAPGEQYLFIGARWVKDVITSDNLQIKDQFINGPMIKNGAVTVDKLSVGDLSAISANLGTVKAGKMLLQRSFGAGSSAVPVYNYPAFKTGLFVDNYGLIVNGSPVQKSNTEATASDMPVVAVTSGEIRFLRTNLTDNIEEVLHTGLSDPDFGYIQFGRDSSGKNALIIAANGQIYLKGENYTDWAVSTIDNRVKWKVQGNLVIVDYDLSFTSGGNKQIATIPTKYVPKDLMLPVSAWYDIPIKDRKAQLNADGGLHILKTEANQRYCGQIIWAY